MVSTAYHMCILKETEKIGFVFVHFQKKKLEYAYVISILSRKHTRKIILNVLAFKKYDSYNGFSKLLVKCCCYGQHRYPLEVSVQLLRNYGWVLGRPCAVMGGTLAGLVQLYCTTSAKVPTYELEFASLDRLAYKKLNRSKFISYQIILYVLE